MSLSSPFDVARSTHEEAERYTAALSSVLATLPSSSSSSSAPPSRSTLTNSHIASILVDRIVSRNRNLVDFYKDETGIRKEEIDLLSGRPAGGDGAAAGTSSATAGSSATTSDVMSLFYSRLNHIKSYHEKYPSAPPETLTLDIPALENSIAPSSSSSIGVTTSAMDRLFSGEEGLGRYLDLNEYHSQYINLKGVKRCNYLAYLERFHDFASEEVGVETKQGEGYQKHLNALRSYLVGYLRKIRPLEDIDGLVEGLEEEFEGKWKVGEVRGWEDQGERFASSSASSSKSASSSSSAAPAAPVPRPADDTGIWCEACGKSFSKQTVFDGHLQGNKHKKALERIRGGPSSSSTNGAASSSSHKSSAAREALLQKGKTLAKQEYLIYALSTGPLDSHRVDTRSNVERRAALTERERAAEAEELARLAEDPTGESSARRRGQEGGGAANGGGGGDDDDSDDENGKIYNPKKLPLGWDGRPIPVWLYKLHGLSVEYSCEICSDFTYQGRNNFDRHFSESRHAFGMRALGLPNTKHFVGITKIQDALKLAEKLKRAGKEGGALGGGGIVGGEAGGAAVSSLGGGGGGRDVEEVEDEQGNTYSRKDYELLKRQGLI